MSPARQGRDASERGASPFRRNAAQDLSTLSEAPSETCCTDQRDGQVDDGAQAGPLLDQVAGTLASFTGDGGYDQDRVYDSVAGAPPHGGRHRAAARDGSAERDGRDRTDAGRPSSPAHRGARPDGLAEGVRVHEASPGRGRHREVEAGDRRRVRSRTDERRATEVAVATHALNRIADATPRVAHPYVMLQGCGSSQPPYQPPKRGHTISAAAPSAGRT